MQIVALVGIWLCVNAMLFIFYVVDPWLDEKKSRPPKGPAPVTQGSQES